MYSHGEWVSVQTHHCPPDHASNMEIAPLFHSYCVFYLEKLEEEELSPCAQGVGGGCAPPALCTAAWRGKEQRSHLSVIKHVLVLHVNGAVPALPG